MTAAAERMRKTRARRRAGLAVYRIAVDEAKVVDALVAAGFLDLQRADNPAEVEAAIERLLGHVQPVNV